MISERIRGIWEISSDYDRIFDYIHTQEVDFTPDPAEKPIFRHAHAFEAVMDQMEINYIPNSLLAGNGGDKFVSRPEHLLKREYDEIERYPERCSKQLLDALREEIFYIWPFSDGHISPHFEKLLNVGIDGVLKELENRLLDDALSESQRDFLQAAIIEWSAVKRLEMRYAEFFENMASQAETGDKRKEYEQIARTIGKVPAQPANSFREALQSVYFLHMCTQFDDVSNHSFGRFDQYMYPYYKADIESGALTKEQAEDLFNEFWIKYTPGYIKSRKEGTRSEGQGFVKQNIPENGLTWLTLKCISHVKHVDDGQTMDICGFTADGEDGTNEISRMAIRVMSEFKTFEPKPVVKYTENIDEDFMDECCKLLASGHGHPAMTFHKNGMKALSKCDMDEEDVRNYCHIGCVELGVAGKAYTDPMNCFFNLPKVLLITLNGGYLGDKLIGLKQTPPETYEQLKENYYAQIDYFLDMYAKGTNEANPFYAQYFFRPLISAVIDGCIEKAQLVDEGGSKYWSKSCNCTGLATAADSLYAVKKLVFEYKKISLDELKRALADDFKDDEPLRLRMKSLPKYGNGMDEADGVADGIFEHYCAHVNGLRTYNGHRYRPGMYSFYETVNRMGAVTGATPNGRHAGEMFSLNSAPDHGAIHNGLTAALKSVTSFDHTLADNACTVDLQLSSGVKPDMIKMIVEYLEKKNALYLQTTVASVEDMYAAEEKPREYEDLTVRVTGFSAQYISLDDQTRREIRERSSWE